MAGGIIYQVDSEGGLTRMIPSKPASEDEIQKLIADHPEMVTGDDEKLLLIRREAPIADASDGGRRWSLDHLFVTRDAKPVLVEVKQATNTQLRREVIGQILEYAANAVLHWGRGRLVEAYRSRFDDEEAADQHLDAFLREGGGDGISAEVANPASFWERVDTNLQSGVLKLVIVADQIPRELARIIEFLNEQMDAEVRGVELRWFTSDTGVKTLVPRIVGATERAAEKKADASSKATNEYWVQLKAAHPDLIPGKPWSANAQDFFALRNGNPKIVVGSRFVKGDLRLFIYFDGPLAGKAYQKLKEKKEAFENAFGQHLEWDDMEGAQASRAILTLPNAQMENLADRQRQYNWLAIHAPKLRDAFEPFKTGIEASIKSGSTEVVRS